MDDATKCAMLGDFNCDFLHNLPQARKLKTLLEQLQMTQLIKEPTHNGIIKDFD